jgi:hypothetical protein
VQAASTFSTSVLAGAHCTTTHKEIQMHVQQRLNASQFDYNHATRTLVQEVSTLGWSRVFGNARDTTFFIWFTENRRVGFVYDKTDSDNEGEVQGWWFKSLGEEQPYRVLIVND